MTIKGIEVNFAKAIKRHSFVMYLRVAQIDPDATV